MVSADLCGQVTGSGQEHNGEGPSSNLRRAAPFFPSQFACRADSLSGVSDVSHEGEICARDVLNCHTGPRNGLWSGDGDRCALLLAAVDLYAGEKTQRPTLSWSPGQDAKHFIEDLALKRRE